MKKVLLTSAAVLAVFAAAAPAFADINGGANTTSSAAYNDQTEFVNARRVNEYIAAHQEDLAPSKAELDQAKAALATAENAPENFSHDRADKLKPYQDAVAAAQAKYDAAKAELQNKAVAELQNKLNTADKNQGTYYIDGETPEQKNDRYNKEHGVTNGDSSTTSDDTKKDDNTKPADNNSSNTADNGGKATDKPAAPSEKDVKKAQDSARKAEKAAAKTTAAKAKAADKAADKKLPNTAAVK